jgi:hypothetical protein
MRRLCERLQAGEVTFEPAPFGDAVHRRNVEPAACHLIPLRRIVTMPGFVDLSRDAQRNIVDGDDNVITATREEKFSRQDRTYAEYGGLDARYFGASGAGQNPGRTVAVTWSRPLAAPGGLPPGLAVHLSTPTYGGVELIDAAELNDDERRVLPPWWLDVAERPGAESVGQAIKQWRDVVDDLLPGFLGLLERDGIGVFLGRYPDGEPILVYALAPNGSGHSYSCLYGYLPVVDIAAHLRVGLGRLPSELIGIHTVLHDKFRNGIALDNGLLPLSELFTAGQFASERMEFPGLDYVPALENIAAVYLGFGTEAVCAELSEHSDGPLGWHWFEAAFELFDFWPLLDSQMATATD